MSKFLAVSALCIVHAGSNFNKVNSDLSNMFNTARADSAKAVIKPKATGKQTVSKTNHTTSHIVSTQKGKSGDQPASQSLPKDAETRKPSSDKASETGLMKHTKPYVSLASRRMGDKLSNFIMEKLGY